MYRKYEKLYRNTLNRASFWKPRQQENCQLDSKLKSVKIKRAVGTVIPGTSLCSNCRAKVKLKGSLIKTKFKRCLTRSRSKPLVSKSYLQQRQKFHLSNFKYKLLTNRFGVSVSVLTLYDQRVTSNNFLNIYAYLREKVIRSKKWSPKRKRFDFLSNALNLVFMEIYGSCRTGLWITGVPC